ncbi:MAG: hypothetical protein ACXVUE_20005 [Solirubrobacteraceae bacterium]
MNDSRPDGSSAATARKYELETGFVGSTTAGVLELEMSMPSIGAA